MAEEVTYPHSARKGYLRRSNIPERMVDKRLADLTIPDAVRIQCELLLDTLTNGGHPYGQGLLLYGAPGRGKTTIGVATLVEALWTVPKERLGHTFEGGAYRPGYYLPYAQLIAQYKKSWETGEDDARDLIDALFCREFSHPYLNTRLLVLDDVGKEHAGGTGFTVNVLHDLLRSRYDASAPTIVTTNLAPENWGAAYGEAMGSFIKEAFRWVPVGGGDRR